MELKTMRSTWGEENKKDENQQKSINIINTDAFYSVLLYRELSNHYKIIVNVSVWLNKTSIAFIVVKLELNQIYHMPAYTIFPLVVGKLAQRHRGYVLMREGHAWRKLGLFDHLYSIFTLSPFCRLSLNMGICWPSLSSKKTSWRCHLLKGASLDELT